MRKIFVMCLLGVVASSSASSAWGLGGDHKVGADGKVNTSNSEWPAGLVDVLNSGGCFHGHFVNANDEFCFRGDTEAFNKFLKAYAALKNTPLQVVIHAGSERASLLWGDKPKEACDWKVAVLRRGWWKDLPTRPDQPDEKYVVTVDVWIDKQVKLSGIVAPKTVSLKSSGEIEQSILRQREQQVEQGEKK